MRRALGLGLVLVATCALAWGGGGGGGSASESATYTGTKTINGPLIVNDRARLDGGVEVNGRAEVDGGLVVKEFAVLDGGAYINGLTWTDGGVLVHNVGAEPFQVDGDAGVQRNFQVGGDAGVNKNFGVGGVLTAPNSPSTLFSAYPNIATVVDTRIGGHKLPATAFTVSAVSFSVSATGSLGSTNATFRVSDGTNNCDSAIACNSTQGNYRVTPTGTCAFAASASLSLSVTSRGDCNPSLVVENLDVVGSWQ